MKSFFNVKKNFKRFSHIKETFLEWSLRANANCYVKIFQYNHFLAKLFWLLILAISLSITAWIISWTIFSYLEYGVTSQIGIVYETPTDFPAVTFCNTNPFTTIQASNQFYTWFDNNYLDLLTTDKEAKMLAANSSYGDDKRKQLGLNINQISCWFINEMCTNDLHWYWDYDYGNCFQFNVGLNYTGDKIEKKQATVEGTNNGLQIKINSLVHSNELTRNFEEGMIVFIHNSSFRPLITDAVFLKVSLLGSLFCILKKGLNLVKLPIGIDIIVIKFI